MNNFIDRFKYAYKRKAFTLIELIIVIAVIAILAGLALPKFMGVRRDANVSALKNDLDTLETVFSMYNVDSDSDALPLGDKVSIESIEKSDNFAQYMLDTYGDDLSDLRAIDWSKANQYLQRLKNDKDSYYYSANSGKIVYPQGKIDADGEEHFVLDDNGILGDGENTNSPSGKVEYEFFPELADTWTAGLANMPTSKSSLTSVEVDGKIYCIGGYNGSEFLNTVEIYDIATNTWTTGTSMPTQRASLTSVEVDGKIYCIGEWNGSSYQNTVEIYDIATNTWTTGTSMPTSRGGLTSQVIDNKIYCIGGYDNSNSYLDTVEIYDIETDTWTTGTSMPTKRSDLTSAEVNGKIYCIGGYDGSTRLNTVEIYDIASDTWTKGASMPTARYNLTSQVIGDKIYCIGGSKGSYLDTVEIYDIKTDSWTTGTSMPSKRGYLTSQVVDGKIYCIGGLNGSTRFNTVEVYDTGYRIKK